MPALVCVLGVIAWPGVWPRPQYQVPKRTGKGAPVPAIADQVANDQNGYCTVQQWIDHECLNVPKLVDIPFAETGEFVYHCHILEHEDAGMMAKIQVIPAAPAP